MSNTKSKKATEGELSELHGLLARFFKGKLLGDQELTAAELGQIRQFLKDNHIEANAEQNPDMLAIAQKLPEFEDDGYDDTEGAMH